VHLEPVLGEVEADGGNLHGGWLLSLWRSPTTTWLAQDERNWLDARMSRKGGSPRRMTRTRCLPVVYAIKPRSQIKARVGL